MKRITLCADDYAQSPPISRAILRLVEMRRIDAVSCLTLSPTWRKDARNLMAVADGQRIGLHFNLTLPFAQPRHGISKIMAASLLRAIDRSWLKRTFDSQWQSFIRFIGRPPDFVDGHQHVHVFPVVREIIASEIASRSPSCTVRNLAPPPSLPPDLAKRRLLETLNHGMLRTLRKHGLTTNHSFAGFRDYERNSGFPDLFRKWLEATTADTLIMCHPGLPGDDPADPIHRCRTAEFRYLSSPDFERDLNAAFQPDSVHRRASLSSSSSFFSTGANRL